ncbi:hypothetical protein AMTR_s00556p00009750, partial [Amborella trichopoda]
GGSWSLRWWDDGGEEKDPGQGNVEEEAINFSQIKGGMREGANDSMRSWIDPKRRVLEDRQWIELNTQQESPIFLKVSMCHACMGMLAAWSQIVSRKIAPKFSLQAERARDAPLNREWCPYRALLRLTSYGKVKRNSQGR